MYFYKIISSNKCLRFKPEEYIDEVISCKYPILNSGNKTEDPEWYNLPLWYFYGDIEFDENIRKNNLIHSSNPNSIKKGITVNNFHYKNYNGLIVLDIDNRTDINLDCINYWFYHKTLSGNGFRVFIKTDNNNTEHFINYINEYSYILESNGIMIDKSVISNNRIFFPSSDNNLVKSIYN